MQNGHGKRKGIILAGGSGTRLYPITIAVSKQLIPVYDKPMIYYPLSTLMLSDIMDILIITNPEYVNQYKRLLGDGGRWGIRISYAIQKEPRGLADAFIVGAEFIDNHPSALILGDNIFYGHGLPESLGHAMKMDDGAVVFGYWVNDPERYGVAEFDRDGNIAKIVEKPKEPKSNWAVTGLYYYDKEVVQYARNIKPSARGEIEITDINNIYLEQKQLEMLKLGRGIAWLDTGTQGSLLEASQFVEAIENRQGLKIACLEEIAWRNGYIDDESMHRIADSMAKSDYGQYLKKILAVGKQMSYGV